MDFSPRMLSLQCFLMSGWRRIWLHAWFRTVFMNEKMHGEFLLSEMCFAIKSMKLSMDCIWYLFFSIEPLSNCQLTVCVSTTNISFSFASQFSDFDLSRIAPGMGKSKIDKRSVSCGIFLAIYPHEVFAVAYCLLGFFFFKEAPGAVCVS